MTERHTEQLHESRQRLIPPGGLILRGERPGEGNAGRNGLTKGGHMTAAGQSIRACPVLLPCGRVARTNPGPRWAPRSEPTTQPLAPTARGTRGH